MSKELIGLLDCNNFFVSCERLFRPDLVDKPVIVLSSNDGCVVARSQEVKDIGVSVGVPYFKLKDIVQDNAITVFSSNFSLYRDVSRRVFGVMREIVKEMEQYSIDEAFFKVSTDPAEQAALVKVAVEKQVGIPVSIGVSATKTQAKYASSIAKKGDGVYVLEPSDWRERVSEIKLATIWGVGGKSALKYRQKGLLTVADLLAADPSRVKQLFGIYGLRLQQELNGISALSWSAQSISQQSIMSSRSFGKEVSESAVLADAVSYHVRHAAVGLRAMHMGATRLLLSIRPSKYGDFALRGDSAETVFQIPTDDSFVLLCEAQKLLKKVYESGVPYKKVSVVFRGLQDVELVQRNLFGRDEEKRGAVGLDELIDGLNCKAGKELIVLGTRLRAGEWQTKLDAKSPAYTTQWSDIVVVKAL